MAIPYRKIRAPKARNILGGRVDSWHDVINIAFESYAESSEALDLLRTVAPAPYQREFINSYGFRATYLNGSNFHIGLNVVTWSDYPHWVDDVMEIVRHGMVGNPGIDVRLYKRVFMHLMRSDASERSFDTLLSMVTSVVDEKDNTTERTAKNSLVLVLQSLADERRFHPCAHKFILALYEKTRYNKRFRVGDAVKTLDRMDALFRSPHQKHKRHEETRPLTAKEELDREEERLEKERDAQEVRLFKLRTQIEDNEYRLKYAEREAETLNQLLNGQNPTGGKHQPLHIETGAGNVI